MERDEILNRIRAAMVRVFQLRDGSHISRATSDEDIDGWDSLSHAMLIMAIENDFGVDLPLERATVAHDVGALVDLVADTASKG